MKTAKEVYDWERGIMIDRTKQKHIAIYDVDFFARGIWNYDSSENDLKKAKAFALKVLKLEGVSEVRIVKSKDGSIIWNKEL